MSPECPWCRTPFGDADRDASRGVATCSNCRALTRLDAGPRVAVGVEQEPIPRPALFTVENEGQVLTVTWPHDASRGLPGLIALPIVLVVLWVQIFSLGFSPSAFGVALLMSLLPLGLLWDSATSTFNRMRLEVSGGGFKLSSGPIPNRFGRHFLARTEVTQLYPFSYRLSKQKLTLFGVRAVLRDGTRADLISELRAPEEALWLEHAIERKLDLKDQYIEGQVRLPGQRPSPAPLDDEPVASTKLSEAVTRPAVAAVARRTGVQVTKDERGTVLRWSPARGDSILWLSLAIGSAAGAAGLAAQFSGPEARPPELGWVLAALGLAGVSAAWAAARRMFNKCFVRLSGEDLTTGEAPLPTLGRLFDRARVRQLYVFRTWPDDSATAKPFFGVKVIMQDGGHHELASGFAAFAEARAIEQTLERELGLRDHPVREEFRGP